MTMGAGTGVMGPAATEARHRTVHGLCYKTVLTQQVRTLNP